MLPRSICPNINLSPYLYNLYHYLISPLNPSQSSLFSTCSFSIPNSRYPRVVYSMLRQSEDEPEDVLGEILINIGLAAPGDARPLTPSSSSSSSRCSPAHAEPEVVRALVALMMMVGATAAAIAALVTIKINYCNMAAHFFFLQVTEYALKMNLIPISLTEIISHHGCSVVECEADCFIPILSCLPQCMFEFPMMLTFS